MCEKESISDFQWRQENVNPRVHLSSGLVSHWKGGSLARLAFSCRQPNDVSSYHRMTSGFYLNGVRLWNSDSNFQMLVTSLFVNKNKSGMSMHCLSWYTRNILVRKLVGCVETYFFAILFRHFHVRNESRGHCFLDSLWEKESITDFQWRQENVNPWVHRSSRKLGKPRYPLVSWTLGSVTDSIWKQCVPLGLKISIQTSGPKVIKLFSCSTQLSMEFVLPKNLKLTTVNFSC